MQSYNIEESTSKPAVYAQLATITKWAKIRSKVSYKKCVCYNSI